MSVVINLASRKKTDTSNLVHQAKLNKSNVKLPFQLSEYSLPSAIKENNAGEKQFSLGGIPEESVRVRVFASLINVRRRRGSRHPSRLTSRLTSLQIENTLNRSAGRKLKEVASHLGRC